MSAAHKIDQKMRLSGHSMHAISNCKLGHGRKVIHLLILDDMTRMNLYQLTSTQHMHVMFCCRPEKQLLSDADAKVMIHKHIISITMQVK